jgi:chromosome segregation ATPase
MPIDEINWAEVDEASRVADTVRNHYRHFQRLGTVISVVRQARSLIDEARREHKLVEEKITAAKAILAGVEARVVTDRKAADDEKGRLDAALTAMREGLSAQHREWTQKIAKVGDEHKQVLAAVAAARAALAKEMEERRAAADRTAAALQVDLDALRTERTTLMTALAQLRRDAAAIAGR